MLNMFNSQQWNGILSERQYHQNDIAPRIELFNRCDAVTAATQPTSQPATVAQAH